MTATTLSTLPYSVPARRSAGSRIVAAWRRFESITQRVRDASPMTGSVHFVDRDVDRINAELVAMRAHAAPHH